MSDENKAVDETVDLVKRLRREILSGDTWLISDDKSDLFEEAADEIDDLRRTIEDLRAYAEQDACAIENMQAERDHWRDIATGLAETSRHGGYCPSWDGFGCDDECGVGDALAAYEAERGKSADGTVEGGGK